ncbi:MAG: ATP-dependent DNA helicase RecG [Anaerolineales bacterium]|nr:MAG: ATP-dependent DNA helicase RecG [Anaerolineales bacterium]
MSSPFETLSKMLTLEKQRGYDNKAVVGGLEQLSNTWAPEAVTQVDAKEERLLIEEIAGMLRQYPSLQDRTQRAALVEDLLSKITGNAVSSVPGKALPAASVSSSATAPAGAGHREAAGDVAHPATPPPPPKPEPPERAIDGLDSPITRLPGIKVGYSRRMANLGVKTIGDMLALYPRRYDDYQSLKTINRLEYGEEVTIIGTVWDTHTRETRRGGTIVTSTLSDGTATIQTTWFNQPWLADKLKPGSQVVISGKVDEYLGRLVFQSPEWEPLDKNLIHTGRLVPVYPLTKGITQKWLRSLMKQTVDYWTQRLPDHLPETNREQLGLPLLDEAVRQIHFPNSWDDLETARRRLAFDEFLLIQLGVLRQRQEWRSQPGLPVSVDEGLLQSFIESLPFDLTQAQQRVLREIIIDIRQPVPMSRLLQGDVGSGKTVVALAAMLVTAADGGQTALMAPTEILAEQHYRSISQLISNFHPADQNSRFTVRLLTGSTPPAERDATYQEIASGEAKLVVGTHALIQGAVEFNNLRLVTIDEQHRFGVQQRASLRDKGAGNPHVLVMSATPIPRTLALTLYGDLDLSVIDEMPPGRQTIITRWLAPLERERAYAFVRSQIEQGRQAFIICPLVEESEKVEAKSAVEEHARLQKEIFPDLKLGLLHGRMKAEEKDAVMRQFRNGELHILVSTAVVEVGIDVPNASVMLVEGANRFGLAQLHQFRGRVGRGEHQSHCLLLADASSADAEARLRVITETDDGFELAEEDLKLRGPGEFFGTRQSGLPDIKLAKLSDARLLEMARNEAKKLFESDSQLSRPEHRLLSRKLQAFWQVKTDPT